MKKNMLKKTLAAVSAVSIAAISMAAFTVSAADAMTIDIEDITLTTAELEALGNEVKVNAMITGNTNEGLTSYQAALLLDDALTFEKVKAGEDFSTVMSSKSESTIGIAGAEAAAVTDEGVLFTLTVTLPDDATAGSVYNIEWTNLTNTKFDDASADEVTLGAGSISIEAVETTTEETTTEATTTTTVAATTAATTTTTAATTVVEPPKTGSTGIAATAAVLVAAAGAAVVVSKKRK